MSYLTDDMEVACPKICSRLSLDVVVDVDVVLDVVEVEEDVLVEVEEEVEVVDDWVAVLEEVVEDVELVVVEGEVDDVVFDDVVELVVLELVVELLPPPQPDISSTATSIKDNRQSIFLFIATPSLLITHQKYC